MAWVKRFGVIPEASISIWVSKWGGKRAMLTGIAAHFDACIGWFVNKSASKVPLHDVKPEYETGIAEMSMSTMIDIVS